MTDIRKRLAPICGPLNINPYFLPKTGQVAVVLTSNILLHGSIGRVLQIDW